MHAMPTSQPIKLPRASRRLTSHEWIDICRGLFAFLVVAAHSVDIAWSIHPEGPRAYPWWLHRFLLYVVAAGMYWVIGFFVISGYCIQLSVSRVSEGGSFPLSTYLAGRLSRILPLYYLALFWAMIVEWLIASNRPPVWSHGINTNVLLAQFFIIQNFTETFGSYAPSWSITNEMFYYVFYGYLVSFAVKRGIRATSLGMMICLMVAVPMNVLYFGWNRSLFVCGLGMLFGLGTFWFLGAMVAEYRDELRQRHTARSVARFWPFVLLAATVMWFSQHVHLQYVYIVLAIAFTLMLINIITNSESPGTGNDSRDTHSVPRILGLASYPTYLFHGPLLMLVASAIDKSNLIRDWRVTWVVLVCVGVSTGVALGYLVEQPMMARRAAWLKSLKPSRGGAVKSGLDKPIWAGPQAS